MNEQGEDCLMKNMYVESASPLVTGALCAIAAYDLSTC